MKFDVIGRIRNMRLPDGKAAILYAVYEAVSNSVHAIEDRFGLEHVLGKGKITVEISTVGGAIDSISISDNGIGLGSKQIEAFETCDSRHKEPRGGKGVGRLIWVKVFNDIKVHTRFVDNGCPISYSFDFVPQEDEAIANKRDLEDLSLDYGTKICLSNIRSEFHEKVRKISFLRDLALHFLSYQIADAMPELTVIHDGSAETFSDFIKDKLGTPREAEFKFMVEEVTHTLSITHMYAESTISKELKNSILLTAHHRVVGDPIEIERKFALNELSDSKVYIGVVQGAFLDDRVDQERIAFRITKEQEEALRRAAIAAAEKFLESHIVKMRARQTETVGSLVVEHPQLSAIISDVEEYVEGLSPGMDQEQIGENLFTLLYREERKISKKIREFSELESLDDHAKKEAEKVIAQVTGQAKNRLAELVVKRRQVLSLMRSFLKYKDDEKQNYHYERAVHDLICPLGEIYTHKEYTRHNLWIVDDLLAYYSFFASDKQIKSLAPDSDSQKEPDLIFFNPLGFRREGTTDPVVLIEFKRPGDERPTKNPVDQILEYVEKLRNKTVRSIEGEVVSEIRENTPFECYVVCDLTQSTRSLLSRSLAPHETPDGEGYFGYAPNHRAAIHVISYKKMLRDAELRNEVFFRKLGLIQPKP